MVDEVGRKILQKQREEGREERRRKEGERKKTKMYCLPSRSPAVAEGAELGTFHRLSCLTFTHLILTVIFSHSFQPSLPLTKEKTQRGWVTGFEQTAKLSEVHTPVGLLLNACPFQP